MIQNSKRTRIKINIKNVVAAKQAHFFVVVQMKEPVTNKSIKFRTETSMLTNRPNYEKNQFTFVVDDSLHIIKFGMMAAKSQLDSDATNAMVFGVCSLPFTKNRLFEQPKYEYETNLQFSERGREVGRFSIRITLSDQLYQLNQSGVVFDPLISRVLYNEECTDQARLESNIWVLEQKLEKIYQELSNSKKQEQFFEKLYEDLMEDEKQIRNEIDSIQKINSKIEHKLNSLENIQNLNIQIDMLSQSEEGKKVLIERLQYFQDRIYRQIQQNQKLAIEYKKIRPEIQSNLKKAEEHAEKLKGKHLQQFEIGNNQNVLKSYDDLLYQFQVNQETIKSLSNMSAKSELTAQQAKLVLSQVTYQIKLAQMGLGKDTNSKQEKLLKQIEKEIFESNKKEERLSQQQEMVYKIKLSALQREIDEVRKKINKHEDL